MAKSVTKVIKVASGISKSGNVISLASGVAGTGLTYTTGTLSIGTGAITSTMILDGTITATDIAAANKDGTAATPSLRTLGTGSTQAAAGNDSRLSDSRTPTGTAGGDLSGTYPNPTIGTGKVTSTHILDGTISNTDISASAAIAYSKLSLTGNIVNADISATAAIALSKLATNPLARANHTGTQTLSTISDAGTSASKNVPATGDAASGEVVLGSDTRLTNSRTPTGNAGGDLTGTYPNPTLVASGTAGTYTKVTVDSKGRVGAGTTLAASDIPSLTLSKISDAGTAASKNIPATGNASATEVVYGTDTRLSDSRTPSGSAGGDLAGTYPNPTIGTGKVTSTHILDGTIVNADINASAAIALSKLATDPLARANHTGTQTASTISNFDTQVRTSRLDQMAAPTASVSLNSQKITNLADPTAAQEAATKNYVDGVANGLDVKASVIAATTANITLSGTQTIDGIALVAGDRVLVKNQTTTSANGIYVVAAGAWTRSTDADSWAELPGAFCFVKQGTTLADTGWVCTVDPGGTLGTTAIAFSQFSGPGTYSAGTGITLTGTTFSIATGAITSTLIADATITDTDVAAANKDGAAGTASMRTLGTGATQAAAGNDSRLSDSRTPTGSAGGDLAGTYPNPTIGTGKVTSTHILDGTIVNADINASAAIALSKLATDPLARANHTGTQTASTISNFDTQVRTSRLDQMAVPTASVSLNSQKITNLATPTLTGDAANKGYVDTFSTRGFATFLA